MNGFVIFDKPKGWSSQKSVSKIKYLLKAKKAGHSGTLDPAATGMLIIALGKATRLLSYLILEDKSYTAKIKLGVATDTLDQEGEVIQTKEVPELMNGADDIVLQNALDCFRGGYSQTPPMYSALKKDGQPLYKLARSGISVERKARDIKIYSLECTNYDKKSHVLDINVKCSKGTYIRSLALDIAEKLGTVGHLIDLRRVSIGKFQESDMCDLNNNINNNLDINQNLDAKNIISIDTVFSDLPKINLDSDQNRCIINGIKLFNNNFDVPDGLARVYFDDKLMAVAEMQNNKIYKRILI